MKIIIENWGCIIDWIGRIANIIILSYLGYCIYRKKDYAKAENKKSVDSGNVQAALIISADKSKDITGAVTDFLNKPVNAAIKSKYTVNMWSYDMKENSISASFYVSRLLDELHKQTDKMRRDGVETVHLFYAGIGALLAPVIADLHNSFKCELYLYQYDSGTYIKVGYTPSPSGS